MMLKLEPLKINKQTLKHAKGLKRQTKRGIQNGFLITRIDLKKATVKGMRAKKTGKYYWTRKGKTGKALKRGRWHRASAPNKGEMPAVLTGDLLRSLGFVLKFGQMLTYGANTPYAKRHELEHGRSYIRRPMINGAKNSINYIARDIAKAIKQRASSKRAR